MLLLDQLATSLLLKEVLLSKDLQKIVIQYCAVWGKGTASESDRQFLEQRSSPV